MACKRRRGFPHNLAFGSGVAVGYKFNINNVSYYKNCGDVGKMKPTIGKPDLSKIKFLD